MQSKANADRRGELRARSVVQTSRARLIGRTPNSAIGIAYYALLLAATPALGIALVRDIAIAAAVAAAAMSAYLAYSLLFVTRMPCVNCWTGHVVNWLLAAILIFGSF